MSLKTRLWVLGTVVVCAGMLFIGIFGGLMPQVVTAQSTTAIAGDIEDQNELLREQIAELESAEGGSSILNEQYADLVGAIPVSADTAAFLGELRQLQTVSGATVSDFTLSDPQSGDVETATESAGAQSSVSANIVKIPVNLVAVGTQQQVADFVHSLQTGPRFVLVHSVEISGTPEESIAVVEGDVFSIATRE
ncbi:type 4a pilus biogenesis protein PilO [Leucobacter denitrificans]|uniref:Type 4a pilus biogenesis protein PilO n=1 Tax=Leucobacter denitrificans TaxID=683042 RepID=A0A7G9S7C9_9MICO|nr:type 4a pilus biogenesis protein PilO [Leucobacter denitrificans]QNN63754.1 type 4a pilus biogenesis protein PilO [Leucobacter denitrificans]